MEDITVADEIHKIAAILHDGSELLSRHDLLGRILVHEPLEANSLQIDQVADRLWQLDQLVLNEKQMSQIRAVADIRG